VPILLGLIVGEIVVIWLTFVDKTLVGTVNVGLIGLGLNLVVLAVATLVERSVGRAPAASDKTGEFV
jgi:SSS family solute:Na+ symporter